MVPNDPFIDCFLHKHAQFPKRAILERFFGIELDILDTAIATTANLGVVHKVFVDHLDELFPLSRAFI